MAFLSVSFALFAVAGPNADARPKKCFGKRINKVVSANNRTVKLKYKDVAWVSGQNVTVVGKPYSRICAGSGRQVIRAGKGLSKTDAGPGDDKIVLHPKSNLNKAYGGLGDDVIIGSNGHDFLYGGPKRNPGGADDRDEIDGGGGNDRIFDYSGVGNVLKGDTGSDRIYSLGNAVSTLMGGKGTDFIYANGGRTEGGRVERLFGERGNDRLYADRAPNNGPAYIDGGSGDDWIRGSDQADTILYQSGIKKVNAGGGDDLIIATSRAAARVDGGGGEDRISYAAHTPPGYRGSSGVYVDLAQGYAVGDHARDQLSNIEDVTGSAFDDEILGKPGQRNSIDGSLGDDTLTGQFRDEDDLDGGLGQNVCQGVRKEQNCNESSPGGGDNRRPVVHIDPAGILFVIGSNGSDAMEIGYASEGSRYVITLDQPGLPSGDCFTPNQQADRTVYCPVDVNRMNGILAYGNRGDDRITVNYSIPSNITTTINAGTGKNVVLGGRSRDQISSEPGSAGSILDGRAGSDDIRHFDAVIAKGGPGHDSIHTQNPCWGGVADGGPGTDNLVFAGSPRGVEADLSKGYARLAGGCSTPMGIKGNVESLEGSEHDDHLIIGRRLPGQHGKSSLLGRGGIDTLDGKNGRRDTITTGDGGHRH